MLPETSLPTTWTKAMKITKINTAVVEGNFDWTFVRVETDEGVQGIGECFFAPGLTAILRELGKVIIGEDPREIRRLFRKLQMAASGAGSVAGVVYNAITGIEMALWDVAGQWLGVPMYRLLGGKFRDHVRIYADCHAGDALQSLDAVLHSRPASWLDYSGSSESTCYFEEKASSVLFKPEMYERRARQMAEQGFTALKFDVDVPNPYMLDPYNRCLNNHEIEYMLGLVEGARKGAGNDVDIAVDCHWRFNVNDARRLAEGCERFCLSWLEDPLPPWNVQGLKELKSTTRTPIATGENLYLFDGFKPLLEQHSLSIVTPDLQKLGGLNEARRIAEYADSQNIVVAPHNISSPIGTMASVHFCASTPNFLSLEFHASDVPFWDDLVEGGTTPLIQHGYIAVPESPGLGIKLNEEVARRYARPGEPFFD
jgi:L-alanine-DL-glutamate epimerase-like enolase superfamily enzyme